VFGVQFCDSSTYLAESLPLLRVAKCFHSACFPGPASSLFPRREAAKSIVGPRRKISVEPMFGLQQRGRSRPGMKVILSGCSKHLLQDPSGSSPSWHFSRSFWVQGLPISTGAGELTTFLFFWHKKQAPFSRTFAVSSGSFSFLVFRARTSAPSDWDSSDD